MTCIVAIAQNGVVYMGSDHAASDEKLDGYWQEKNQNVLKMVSMELRLQIHFAWDKSYNTCGPLQNTLQLKPTQA